MRALASHLCVCTTCWLWCPGEHVLPVMDALDENMGLHVLNLAWNGLGNDGAVPLGKALRLNQQLRTLDISHNEIQEKGVMVIADALKENTTLTDLRLDSNPIGPDGGRAVLRALRTMVIRGQGHSRQVSLAKCNLECEDGEDLFDPLEPGGDYIGDNSLDLSDPYKRVIANELVELAWNEDGENWDNELLDGKPFELPEPGPGEVWTRENYTLPEEGVLSLTYVPTKRVPRMEDVLNPELFDKLKAMMREKSVVDQGISLLKLAASEFFFVSRQVAELIGMFTDSPTRISAVSVLLERTVDYMNWTGVIFRAMTDGELRGLENKLGPLFYFTPSNPTGHYRLQLANPYERLIAQKIIEISSEEKLYRKKNGMINTSQRGVSQSTMHPSRCHCHCTRGLIYGDLLARIQDWDNWRNEQLDHKVSSTACLPACSYIGNLECTDHILTSYVSPGTLTSTIPKPTNCP
jgi:hypothetical protein